jgi:hypothetical protein
MPIDDLPAPTKSSISDLPAPPQKEEVDPIKMALSKSALAPTLIIGAAELGKGLGAATELVAPETGKKIYGGAERLQKYVKEAAPVAGTIGQVGSYAIPYGGVEKGIQGVKALTGMAPAVTRFGKAAGRVGEAATTGGIVGGLTTPTEEGRGMGTAIGATLGGGLQGIGEIGKEAYSLLNRAFGGDVKRLANALRDLSAGKASEEAKLADQVIKQSQRQAGQAEKTAQESLRQGKQQAGIAEKAAGKQERIAEQRLRQEPGVTLQKEAGAYKPIGESPQTLGERIRGYTNQLFDQLKARRQANAEKLKQAAFGEAYQKEVAGQRITDTKAFKNLDQEIRATLANPVTGLSSESSQLTELAKKLQPTKEVNGVIVGKPISFAELDNIRRLLKDRSYGLPAEGFDAIGQIEAGNMAKAVEKIMKEFVTKSGEKTSSFEKYLNQYAKDSEPLRVFQSKIGKALVDEQLVGKGTNYAKVPAESIANKVFANKENFQALTDALAGNRQLAVAEAKKYFSSQMEGIKTADQAAKFIAKNRDMLKEVGMYDQVNRFARDLSQAGRRAEAANGAAKEAETVATQRAAEAEKSRKGFETTATQAEKVKESFRKHESDILTARDPSDVARKNMAFAKDLLAQGRIDQNQYRQLINASNEILTKVADTDAAKRQALIFTGKVLGVGAIGSLGYYGLKNIGG